MYSISNDPILTGVFLSLQICMELNIGISHRSYARTPGGLDLIILGGRPFDFHKPSRNVSSIYNDVRTSNTVFCGIYYVVVQIRLFQKYGEDSKNYKCITIVK